MMRFSAIVFLVLTAAPTCLARMNGSHGKHDKVLSPQNSAAFQQILPVVPQARPQAPVAAPPQPQVPAAQLAQPQVSVTQQVQQQAPAMQAVQPNQPNEPNQPSRYDTATEYVKRAGQNVKVALYGWWAAITGAPYPEAQPVPIKPVHALPPQRGQAGAAGTTRCFAYTPGGIDISDWDNAANLGWTARNELGVTRISLMSPVLPPNQGQLVLKNLQCNAAEYSARIRLDDESSAGLVFRAKTSLDRNSMVVELNTLTKSIALKKMTDGHQELIDERTDEMIQPQILQKVKIIDHGSDGLIEVELNEKQIIKAAGAPYFGYGSFGPWIGQGSAVFSDLSSREK